MRPSCLLLLLALLARCAASHPDVCPNPMPPVAGNPADGCSTCRSRTPPTTPRRSARTAANPGIVALPRWLGANTRGVFWGSYRCEKWGKDSASLHAENRAIDWHLDGAVAGRPQGRRQAHPPAAGARHGRQPAGARPPHGRRGADLGLRVLGCRDDRLQALPRLLHEAGASRARSVDQTAAHRDHIHIGMTKAGRQGAARASGRAADAVRGRGRHTRLMRRGVVLVFVAGVGRAGRRRLRAERLRPAGRRARRSPPRQDGRRSAAAAERCARRSSSPWRAPAAASQRLRRPIPG